MLETDGYSLWLMPSGDVFDELNSLITRLSERYGTPDFPPHVTLVGQVSDDRGAVLSKAERVAAMVDPYTITLQGVDYFDTYFQTLFLRVDTSDEVMTAYDHAASVFGVDDEYVPHLSLLYGDLDAAEKERIRARLDDGIERSFTADTLYVHDTDCTVEEWERVASYPL